MGGARLTSNTLYKLTQYRAPTHEPLHQNILSSGVLINNVKHSSSASLLATNRIAGTYKVSIISVDYIHFVMKSRMQAYT